MVKSCAIDKKNSYLSCMTHSDKPMNHPLAERLQFDTIVALEIGLSDTFTQKEAAYAEDSPES